MDVMLASRRVLKPLALKRGHYIRGNRWRTADMQYTGQLNFPCEGIEPRDQETTFHAARRGMGKKPAISGRQLYLCLSLPCSHSVYPWLSAGVFPLPPSVRPPVQLASFYLRSSWVETSPTSQHLPPLRIMGVSTKD